MIKEDRAVQVPHHLHQAHHQAVAEDYQEKSQADRSSRARKGDQTHSQANEVALMNKADKLQADRATWVEERLMT
jgi:hypothetical protein